MINSNNTVNQSATQSEESTAMNTNTSAANNATPKTEEKDMKNTENKAWAWTKKKFTAIKDYLKKHPRLYKALKFIWKEIGRIYGHTLAWLGLPAFLSITAYGTYKAFKGQEKDLESKTSHRILTAVVILTAIVGAAIVIATGLTAIFTALVGTTLVAHYSYDIYKHFSNKKEEKEKKSK